MKSIKIIILILAVAILSACKTEENIQNEDEVDFAPTQEIGYTIKNYRY